MSRNRIQASASVLAFTLVLAALAVRHEQAPPPGGLVQESVLSASPIDLAAAVEAQSVVQFQEATDSFLAQVHLQQIARRAQDDLYRLRSLPKSPRAVSVRSQASVATAAPVVRVATAGSWSPPEGCLVPMSPKERKSVEEAHRCWDGLLAQYPWSQGVAFGKMFCESGGNPDSMGDWVKIGGRNYRAEGIMQILPGGSHDPATNMAQAWEKYSAAGGWSPWQC